MTKIRYGINQRIPKIVSGRKKIVHENHSATIKGKFDDKSFLNKVIDHVQRTHPGWGLTGYVEVKAYNHKEQK